ncbi:MAG: hypothetical protein QOH61_2470 [Chloroflexota bacterium]|nr:hypothetical protein [Chloroflexota bacterium]
MRRSLCISLCAAALVLFPSGASATGPGGWDHLGTGNPSTNRSLNGAVGALHGSGGVLYAGGSFTDAGGVANGDRIAKWNGVAWSALGPGIGNGIVNAIAVAGGIVYAGGTFLDAGGDPKADYLAMWNGTTWSHFCNRIDANNTSAFDGNVRALQVIGNKLHVGGSFLNGAGYSSADGLLTCELGTGAATSLLNFNASGQGVYALAADSNGVLYAGGPFINFDTTANADKVAMYTGTGWTGLGPGVDGVLTGIVRSLATSGTDLYIGTDQIDVNGIAQADHVAKWDGAAWSAVGANTAGTNGWFAGTSATISGLTAIGSNLFAIGTFSNANGNTKADHIAWFDGSDWSPLGSDGATNGPLNASGLVVTTMGGTVFAGGSFTSAGGDNFAWSAASFRFQRPDARIGTSASGPFVGNDVYNATAAGQQKSVSVARGSSRTLYLDIQNDGRVSGRLLLKGTGAASGFTVKYVRGTTNVTSAVLAGTYLTPTLAPGARVGLKLVVTLAASTASSATFKVVASSQPGTPVVDAVKAKVNAT